MFNLTASRLTGLKKHALPLRMVMEMIARPAAGKTTFLTAINETCEGTHLPSGLHFGVKDPLAANQLLQSIRQRRKELQSDNGLASTQHAEEMHYLLQEGEETRVEFVTHEVIGQVLVGTTDNSPAAVRQMYDSYVGTLRQANTLVAMVPAPTSEDDGASRVQYKEDLRLTNAYLRHALSLHNEETHCAVAIVVTKLDALFSTEKEARAALTDGVMKQALGPLVQTVAASSKVRDAVIVPTSSFGFGRSEVIADSSELSGGRGTLHRLIGDEMEPYNIAGLLVWTLLHGLLPQTVSTGEQEMAIAKTVQSLADDLEELNPWLVPIKSRGKVSA